MRKIDKNILDSLGLSTIVFKYPTHSSIIETQFDPYFDKDYENYMIIKKEGGEIRLSNKVSFLHEGVNTDLIKGSATPSVIKIKDTELLDGFWWILP